jgi:hypothetical protein
MKKTHNILSVLAVTSVFVLPSIAVADPSHKSSSPPIWTFAAPPPDGSTKLVRTPNGLTAQFRTSGLTAGHAVTMWIMFFDNPEACTIPGACNPGVDIGKPGVRFDFHYAAGHIVNGAKTTLTGHLQTGELSTSGWAELVEIGDAPPEWVTPLTNPLGAQVILAIHSHGPAQTGRTLVEQTNSYLGGCVLPFLGDPGGFAQSAADLPANPGECSTIQLAFHNP